jgi:hypothetical protein
MKYKYVSFKVKRQGAPEVEGRRAWIQKEYKDIIAFVVPMKSKWCKIGATTWASNGSLGCIIDATSCSRYLRPKTKRNEWTEITFPKKYKDWHIFSCSEDKYSLDFCLIKDE